MRFGNFTSIALLGVFLGAHGMEREVVLSFALKDVIHRDGEIGLTDFIGLVTSRAIWNPRLLMAATPANFNRIRSRADEIAQTTKGICNIVRTTLTELKDQGYGDLTSLEDEIVRRSTNPIAIALMAARVKELKEQGYTVIGASDYDWREYQVYREKMQDNHRVDMNDLFSAVLTIPVIHELPKDLGEIPFYQSPSDRTGTIYVTASAESIKPKMAYFRALKALAKKINTDHALIIHTDNERKHIDAAQQEGISGVHFNIRSGAAYAASDQELEATITDWHGQIRSLLPKNEWLNLELLSD